LINTIRRHCSFFFIIACVLLGGCSRQPAVLTFVSDIHTPTVCGVLPANQDFRVTQMTFYISELKLLIDGNWQDVDFFPSDTQTEHTAIIDLTPRCADASVQTQVQLPLAIGYHRFAGADAVRFTLGVPFDENHKDPLTQPAPLNEPSMFWSWQRGYKFLRWDLQQISSGRGWSYHLGSVGCVSASALRAPETPCALPNRVEITMQKDSSDGFVFVEAQKLLMNIDLSSSSGCMFNVPREADCDQLYANTEKQWITWLNR